ncbi:MAG: AAA family ATPase, partial [Desulfobaccales bacterium]
TYAEMLRLAARHLAAGRGVILDASFKRAYDRERARLLAREHQEPVLFVYCACPPEEARRRLGIRLTDPQAVSDGRVELFEAQARDFDPPGPEDQPLLRLHTQRQPARLLEELRKFIEVFL